MVKKGPCSHCRINSTPLWRNGPAEKPVLCNACGSRYKLKGHLHNYLPKHHKNYAETLNVEDQLSDHLPHDGNSNDSSPDFHDTSEQDFWNDTPTRKRSRVVQRQMTPMQKFHNQLLSLYKSEEEQSNESSTEEDILVYNVNNFIPSNEIGLGVVLLKTDPGSLSCSSSSDQAQPESSTTAP